MQEGPDFDLQEAVVFTVGQANSAPIHIYRIFNSNLQ